MLFSAIYGGILRHYSDKIVNLFFRNNWGNKPCCNRNAGFLYFECKIKPLQTKTKHTSFEKRLRKALAWDEAIDDETIDYYSHHADYDENDNGTMEVPPDLTVYLDDYEE